MIFIKVLCLDQATVNTGYSIVKKDKIITYGLLEVNPDDNKFDRIKAMRDKIVNLINLNDIKFVLIEDCQLQFGNVSIFQTLTQLQGVLISKFMDLDLGFYIVKPSEWRKVCGIKGRKREEQKANAINHIKENYKINVSEDTSEAICIGEYAIKTLDIK